MFHFEENLIVRLSKQKTKKTNNSTNIFIAFGPFNLIPLIDFILQEQHQILTERKKITLLTRRKLSD